MRWLYRGTERLMAMDEATWARHANPLSVYTRIPILPLLVLALWSRVWLGWAALFPIGLVVVWIWANPRFFPPPLDLDTWASRGVLGERVFLNRRDEIPPHHRIWADGLSLASVPGAVLLVIGVIWLNLSLSVFGTILTMVPKIWFVDRMNWIYADWLATHKKELGDV